MQQLRISCWVKKIYDEWLHNVKHKCLPFEKRQNGIADNSSHDFYWLVYT